MDRRLARVYGDGCWASMEFTNDSETRRQWPELLHNRWLFLEWLQLEKPSIPPAEWDTLRNSCPASVDQRAGMGTLNTVLDHSEWYKSRLGCVVVVVSNYIREAGPLSAYLEKRLGFTKFLPLYLKSAVTHFRTFRDRGTFNLWVRNLGRAGTIEGVRRMWR